MLCSARSSIGLSMMDGAVFDSNLWEREEHRVLRTAPLGCAERKGLLGEADMATHLN